MQTKYPHYMAHPVKTGSVCPGRANSDSLHWLLMRLEVSLIFHHGVQTHCWLGLQNRTQLSYLWEKHTELHPSLNVLLFCNNDWLIFNCCWTKRLSEASQSQKARSGQFWLGSNNFLLHPDHKTLRERLRHITALGGASGMLHYNLLWTLERRGFRDIVAIYADFSSLWWGPLYKFPYSEKKIFFPTKWWLYSALFSLHL